MSLFKKLFGFDKKENTNTRTFKNMERGLNNGYLLDYQIAESAYLAGDPNKALSYINSTIQKSDISDWRHYAFRANVYEDQNNFTEAITDYNKAIELSNSELSVYQLYHQIGICYLNLGNNKKAEEFYTAAIDIKKKHPNSELNPDLEGMMGGVLMGLPFERLYNNRGNARKNLGKLNEGFEDCRKALEYNPNYSNPYLLAGQIQQQAGNIAEAERLLKEAIRLGNPNAKRILDALHSSEPSLQKPKANTDPGLILQQSMQACDSGNYDKAVKLGEELLNVHKLPTGYYALGLVYAVLENWNLAKQNCLEAYKYFPQVADNINRLGVACCYLGNINEGLSYFRKGIELGDTNCKQNFRYWSARL